MHGTDWGCQRRAGREGPDERRWRDLPKNIYVKPVDTDNSVVMAGVGGWGWGRDEGICISINNKIKKKRKEKFSGTGRHWEKQKNHGVFWGVILFLNFPTQEVLVIFLWLNSSLIIQWLETYYECFNHLESVEICFVTQHMVN